MDSNTSNEAIIQSAVELLMPAAKRTEIPAEHFQPIRDMIQRILGDTDLPTVTGKTEPPYLAVRSAESMAVDLVRNGQTLADFPNMPLSFRKEVIRKLRDVLEKIGTIR